MESIKQVIIRRDDLTIQEADALIMEARKEVLEGADPEEVLYNYFRLELDYIFDLF